MPYQSRNIILKSGKVFSYHYFYFFFLCVVIYVMYMFVSRCAWPCTHMWKPEVDIGWMSFYISPPDFLRLTLSLNLKFADSARLVSWSPQGLVASAPWHWVYRCALSTPGLYVGAGDLHLGPHDGTAHSTLSHLPSPSHHFLVCLLCWSTLCVSFGMHRPQ